MNSFKIPTARTNNFIYIYMSGNGSLPWGVPSWWYKLFRSLLHHPLGLSTHAVGDCLPHTRFTPASPGEHTEVGEVNKGNVFVLFYLWCYCCYFSCQTPNSGCRGLNHSDSSGEKFTRQLNCESCAEFLYAFVLNDRQASSCRD